jgi:hypothetical protein
MPDTDCRTDSNLSWVAFRTIICLPLVVFYRAVQIWTKFSLQGAFSPLFAHKTGFRGVKSPKTGLWSGDMAV